MQVVISASELKLFLFTLFMRKICTTNICIYRTEASLHTLSRQLLFTKDTNPSIVLHKGLQVG